MTAWITPSQFHAADGVEDWRVVGDGACAHFRTAAFGVGARFVAALAGLPGIEEHPPDVDLRPHGVTVRLVTLNAEGMGMTHDDVDAARAISALARAHGLVADPAAVQSILVIPGAPGDVDVMPFWQAVLGYERRPDSPEEDLVDPGGRGPAFWFERMDQPAPGGGGAIHVAVWVPFDQAQARIAAAVAAGGRIVREQHAPAWWTLADPAGNEADISTIASRD